DVVASRGLAALIGPIIPSLPGTTKGMIGVKNPAHDWPPTRSYFRRPLRIWYTRFFEIPYSLARSGTVTPWAYRARISELRLRFLRVLGDCGSGEDGDPGYSRFTR